MKIAFVVDRYGIEVSGGAELHCRWIAEHLAKHHDVSVITTCALNYMDWGNHYPAGMDVVNGIPVHRFSVLGERDLEAFSEASQLVFHQPHSEADELRWLDLQGPRVPDLVSHIEANANEYDIFIFFTYLYYTTFYGLPVVKEKSLLVPTAHDELPIRLTVFRRLFSQPRFIICNTPTEREFVHRMMGNSHVPSAVVGTGIDRPPKVDAEAFRRKYGILGDFILYVGRINGMKGCLELLDRFLRYRADTQSNLKLLLVGKSEIDLPKIESVVQLGFLSEEEKSAAIQASSVVMVPSRYESLSMIALEAWLSERPVLVNGNCHVLRDMCIRSNGGLYYTCYDEFRGLLTLLLGDAELRAVLGGNGRRFVEASYDWTVVEKKYLEIIEGLR